jgi:hypothetical protein
MWQTLDDNVDREPYAALVLVGHADSWRSVAEYVKQHKTPWRSQLSAASMNLEGHAIGFGKPRWLTERCWPSCQRARSIGQASSPRSAQTLRGVLSNQVREAFRGFEPR